VPDRDLAKTAAKLIMHLFMSSMADLLYVSGNACSIVPGVAVSEVPRKRSTDM